MNWRIFNDTSTPSVPIPVNMARVCHIEPGRSLHAPDQPNGRARLVFGKDHYLEVNVDEVFHRNIADFLVPSKS